MYVFAYEYIKESDFKTIMKEFKKLGEDYSQLDEESKTFINIIESLTNKYESGEHETNENNEEENNSSSFTPPDLFGGVIGDLAKEIVNEIDPEELNLEVPSKILGSLFL